MGKLIFEGFKKRPKREPKSERIVLLGVQKDKREPDTGPIVLLEAPIRK
ncbi:MULTISPECIES: hypothetical protein [Heyndrickxia]|nr:MULTISPECIES: hypothetical protein [Heyndrickxia]MED4867042.1 hypothetical protein [Weizmannia sp. CD-2023]MED4891328.1 hypothetical protein [Weizmannia sp. CD-2023]MED4921311.1 hypothetical protein [Weizmannia sp. CD-2023]